MTKKKDFSILLSKKILFLFVALFVVPLVTFSQDSLLTFQKAVEYLLLKNYDIRIAEINSQQASNNNTAGNAGMLPAIDLNGAYTKSSNSLDQKYNTGNEVKRDASSASNTTGNIVASWTIFDGLNMFSLKEKLSMESLQSKEQLKMQMENSMMDVTQAYYSLVRQQQLLRSMQEEIKFAEERDKIAERKFNNGSASRLELLQAKTDLNRQRSAEIKLISDADESRISLNRLMGLPVETTFSVEDSVSITYLPRLEDLKKTVQERNSTLNYYNRNRRIALLSLRESKSLRLPIVKLNAGYSYAKSTSEAGFILYNKSNGFNYGASASFPLFRGFTINNQVKNARLEIKQADIEFESANAQVQSDLFNSLRAFNGAMDVLRIEEQNSGFAKEVLTVSQERYRVGVSNIVEMLDAQRTYEEAMSRLADARFAAKIAEASLKKVNGDWVVFGIPAN